MTEREPDGLSNQIASYIAQQIIMGDLVEGERIQELRIAKEMKVSRGTVREALLILQRSYLIDIFPRRGAVVCEMSVQQVKTLFEAMALVLGFIAQKMSTPWRAEEQLRVATLRTTLQQRMSTMDVNLFYDDIFQFLEDSHAMINNPYITQMFAHLYPAIRRSYYLVLHIPKIELEESFGLFSVFLDAAESRKNMQATEVMNDFCKHLCELVVTSFMRIKQIELAWAKRSHRMSL